MDLLAGGSRQHQFVVSRRRTGSVTALRHQLGVAHSGWDERWWIDWRGLTPWRAGWAACGKGGGPSARQAGIFVVELLLAKCVGGATILS